MTFAFIVMYALCVGLACLPGLFLLAGAETTSVDGVTTLEDAVRAGQESGLFGWDLVGFAQTLTAQKFTYSRRNSWESPAKAFARGQGYCVQQALALKRIYDELGIVAVMVHGRGDFPGATIHGIKEPGGNFNHCWLDVRVDGESRYVCPGNPQNEPGKLHFKITGKVMRYTGALHVLTFTGAIIVNAVRDFHHTGFHK